jgi:hypothetical protein
MTFDKAFSNLIGDNPIRRSCWDSKDRLIIIKDDRYDITLIIMVRKYGKTEKWFPNQDDILADDWEMFKKVARVV